MNCAYTEACSGAIRPLWIHSVGIPLCERHYGDVQAARSGVRPADPMAMALLAAAAVTLLRAKLADREIAHAA